MNKKNIKTVAIYSVYTFFIVLFFFTGMATSSCDLSDIFNFDSLTILALILLLFPELLFILFPQLPPFKRTKSTHAAFMFGPFIIFTLGFIVAYIVKNQCV